jgi:hypothetical protein
MPHVRRPSIYNNNNNNNNIMSTYLRAADDIILCYTRDMYPYIIIFINDNVEGPISVVICDGLACHRHTTHIRYIWVICSYFARRVFQHGVFFLREKPPINVDRRSRYNYAAVAAFRLLQSYAHARTRVCTSNDYYISYIYRGIHTTYIILSYYIYVLLSRPKIVRCFFRNVSVFRTSAAENPL